MMTCNIALAQLKNTPFDINRNVETVRRQAIFAASRGADLILFPEMFLTGYLLGGRAKALALSTSHPVFETLRQTAAEHHIAIVTGFAEQGEGGVIYNSAAWIDRDGSIAGVYRKTHLFGESDKAQFAPGQGIAAFDTTFGRVGMLICYDLEFPEPARLLALDGAKLLCVVSANMYPYEKLHTLFAQARAVENGFPVAYVNAVGQEGDFHYCGRSSVFTQSGDRPAQAGEQGAILYAQIDLGGGMADANMDYLQNRRSDLY